ncbi:polysaccharide pyruvyl transferase family protein [Paenibacillus thiaminolyticus]|uniref:polysaccharide pyruvyl transferase family protein n=1 Tax=Paenibacillus thiaminolyticus TaxID=49283 RepID=UPI0035A6C821
MMHIAVCGYYGMGNFGDDVCLRTLQKRLDGHAVYPWLPQMSPDDTDAVIIGGGDLITLYSFNPYYFPAALRNHPTWVYSVGIVDAYPEETWPEDQVNRYRERIRRAQKAIFRDAHSLAIASRAGFHPYPTMAPDIAFGYQAPRFPVKRLSDRPTIGIIVFAYSSFPFEAMLRLFLRLSSQGYHLALIPVINHPTNGFSDFGMCNRLYQAMKARDPRSSVESLPLLMELDVTYSIIQSMDMLISYKLHPSLAALRAGKPVFAFSTMSKVRSLLRQFGMEEYVCSYQEPEEVYWSRIEDFLEYGQAKAQAALPRIRQTERESVRQLRRLKADIEQQCRQHRRF